MNSINKFGTFEAISLVTIILLNNIILSMPADIVRTTSSGAWINVIFITIIAIAFIIFIYKMYKNFPSMDIIDICNFLGGAKLKFAIGFLFVIMFIISSSTHLRMFADLLQIIYLQHTPLIFILAFFILGVIIANKIGIGSMGKVASVSVIIGVISFILLIGALSPYYNIYNLFPVLGYGSSTTFLAGLSNIYAFSGISLLYFIKPTLINEKDFSKVCILSVLVSGVLLILCILNQILIFGSIFDSDVLAGMVLSSRMINFGNFFERVDAIFTFIWIFTHISYLSILSCLILYVLKKVLNTSDQNGILYCIISLIFAVCLLPENFPQISDTILPFTNGLQITVIFVLIPIVLIIANLKYKRKYLYGDRRLDVGSWKIEYE